MDMAYFFAGLILGIGATYVMVRKMFARNIDQTPELNRHREECAAWKARAEQFKIEADKANLELVTLIADNATLKQKTLASEEKLKDLNTVRENLSKEFENLANRILKEKMDHFQKDSESKMGLVLNPFKEKLEEFQERVAKYREEEIKDTSSLKTELAQVLRLNQKLSLDAENLTKALKGDTKLQGNWGELILERVLEGSGLRSGEEYVLQGRDMNLKNDEGGSSRPDVIVMLPEGKHIIIDAKVSLVSYEKHISAEDELTRAVGLKEFLLSLRRHITGLSDKKYQLLDKIIAPDFVLMFVPVEGAFATALQNDSELFQYAWDKKVIMVSPTTLMVTLRTVESIWRQEKQNKNAFEIARQAGELYDKFAGFSSDMVRLKNSLDTTSKHYDEAVSKLSNGKGNIVGRLEKIKTLGAKTSKNIELTFDET